jgi:spermidine/putrescine transport system ATP-binding protein
MADTIAVMNKGRIERMGGPTEIYEDPRTAFVAGFLGASNLMGVTVADRGTGRCVLADGSSLFVEPDRLPAGGAAHIGVRPEKIRLFEPTGADLPGNHVTGKVSDASFIGVSTHYLVDTPVLGELAVVIQNLEDRRYAPGEEVVAGWNPEHSFVVSL